MITTFIVQLVLSLLVLLVVVPAATGGSVAVRRGGLLRGLLTLVVIAVLNRGLWLAFGLLTLGATVVFDFLLLGLVGILVNALAFKLASWLMPDVLQVRSYGSACWASLIMTVAGYFIGQVNVM